MLSSAE